MPRFQTNLLVRDNRPAALTAAGAHVQYRTLTDAEFTTELRRKLMEEAEEAATATPENLANELGDVLETMLALAAQHGITEQDIRARATAKLARLGGFTQRVYSEWLEAPEDSEAARYHRQYPEKYPEIVS